MTAPAPTIDARVAELLAAGTPDQAAVLVLETHGPGIFRMLRGVFHDDDVAEAA